MRKLLSIWTSEVKTHKSFYNYVSENYNQNWLISFKQHVSYLHCTLTYGDNLMLYKYVYGIKTLNLQVHHQN